MGKMKKLIPILQILKYLFFLFLLIQITIIYRKSLIFLCGAIELLLILWASGYIIHKFKTVGYILNFVALLIYGLELIVFRFGGSFVTVIMVTNLESIQGISGKVVQYLIYAVAFIVALVIPTPSLKQLNVKRGYIVKDLVFYH